MFDKSRASLYTLEKMLIAAEGIGSPTFASFDFPTDSFSMTWVSAHRDISLHYLGMSGEYRVWHNRYEKEDLGYLDNAIERIRELLDA